MATRRIRTSTMMALFAKILLSIIYMYEAIQKNRELLPIQKNRELLPGINLHKNVGALPKVQNPSKRNSSGSR